VSLSRSEHARLVERARLARRSLISFVRIAAISREMPEPPVPAVNLAAIGELNRIGNNLNQAVHLLHTGYLPSDFGKVLSDLEGHLKSLKRQLAGLPARDADR
jgi:hypothetical protein